MTLLMTLLLLIVAVNCAYATDYPVRTCGNVEIGNTDLTGAVRIVR